MSSTQKTLGEQLLAAIDKARDEVASSGHPAKDRGLFMTSAMVAAEIAVLARYMLALEKRLAEVEGKGIKYAGVWQRAQDYVRGDVATHDGSAWVVIAEQTRATPGTTDGWQLLVKGAR